MSLVGYWKMDGNSTDYSGNGYNGTDSNITYVAGKNGQEGDFNGTSSGITLPSITGTFQTTTITAWIITNDITAIRLILNLQNTADNADMLFGIRTNSKLYLETWNGSTAKRLEAYTGLSTGKRYFITATRNGANYEIFLNAKSDGIKSDGHTIDIVATTGNRIGRHPSASAYWNGRIDEMQIHNTVLTPQQIKTLYMQQSGMF